MPNKRKVSPEQWMKWVVAIASAVAKILQIIHSMFH